ncbi:MAG: NAD(P)H-dependent oxidoreductase [Selenomonadaceae bacterium]|nr:NAD(P)H-dependent oxidoreductase [Selenomonadaceae bacterium]
MGKTLVIYYSRRGQNYVNGKIVDLPKGNTEIVAEFIQKAANADLFEVATKKAYPDDYTKCTIEAKDELRNDIRPELVEMLSDVASYDNIVVAGPCWWGTYPAAIFTQLEQLDFAGKKVFPVMTHEGSGLAGAPAALKKYCQGASVGEGLAIHGAEAVSSEKEVAAWAKRNLV